MNSPLTQKMEDTIMGYMYINDFVVSESASTVVKESLNEHKDDSLNQFYITFDTILQDFDVKNRNNRYYDLQNVWGCIQSSPKIQGLLRTGGWFGEFDHPAPNTLNEKLSPERIRNVPPEKRAFKIMNPRTKGNYLCATIQSAAGQVGTSFRDEILNGWQPQFSLRAIASMIMKNGKPYVQVRYVITYDAPWYPSHVNAHSISDIKVHKREFHDGSSIRIPGTPNPTGFMESANDEITKESVMIPLKDILKDVGEKDVNAGVILESFGLDFDDMIGFDADHSHVLIQESDNIIYANISPTTTKRVNDFFASF